MVSVGDTFGRLTVVISAPRRPPSEHRYWWCTCNCGVISKSIRETDLRLGKILSCGCFGRERTVETKTKHGHSGRASGQTSTYYTWAGMIARCGYPKNRCYAAYGGRGISVCERWHSFENFLADMGERPADRTIDRIDVNGNYEPNNCRWATSMEQSKNTRRNLRAQS